MTGAPEEFESLRKLLKIKQYEQPPPGYFKNFAGNVTARLEDQAAPEEEGLWVRKFFGLLQTNPLAAGFFGVAMCGLLILGIVFSYVDVSPASGTLGSLTELQGQDQSGALALNQADNLQSSTSPVLSTNLPGVPSLGVQGFGIQPVNFTAPAQ